MTAITASMVKELRERTGAGMMECKKALQATEGDVEKAIDNMRKAGQAKADKKAGRTAAEGIVVIKSADNSAVILEVNSETDFVARDENFLAFANTAAETALNTGTVDIPALSESAASGQTESVEQMRANLVAKIGENIQLRRATLYTDVEHLGTYVHGGKIGVLVNLKGGNADVAKDIAMHIAASKPVVVNRDDVPADLVEREREIYSAQAQESGKPAEIIEKMTEGRLKKFLDEVSLVGQAFVKDASTTIGQLLKQNSAEVVGFVRFEVGEGIEKKVDNFVEEVMAQAKGAS